VPTVITNSQLVIVPALVRGASGELMQTLHASDFLLTDNGVPQTVRLEEVEHQPLSIVVLMQTGGSAPREFPDYAKLGTMLTYLTAGSPYEIAMVTFDSQPEDMWEFTQDVADLEDGFVKPAPGDGKAAILDAVSTELSFSTSGLRTGAVSWSSSASLTTTAALLMLKTWLCGWEKKISRSSASLFRQRRRG
jgi:hypothetical protein